MELKSPKAKKKPLSRFESWSRMFRTPLLILFLLGTSRCDEELSSELSMSNSTFKVARHRHNHIQPSDKNSVLNDIKYLRRHLNKEVVNFVMTDVLMDGEVENRVHYNGITAKETYVGSYG
ncbi:hypothetical protein O0L34_g6640 [Tuta absoluta]|nr:hypothetical protein O0L34_g6640 [Tuta absoluta]